MPTFPAPAVGKGTLIPALGRSGKAVPPPHERVPALAAVRLRR
jgi:hypothetical protein